jgi:hypothetical protein
MKVLSIYREFDMEPEYSDHPEIGWADYEIESLKKYLSELNTPEAKLEKINLYLTEENLISHNIPERLLSYATDYYTHKIYEERHPEVQEYDLNDEQLKELGELSTGFRKSIQGEIEKIGVFEYNEKFKKEVPQGKEYHLPYNIRILDFLNNERKKILNLL